MENDDEEDDSDQNEGEEEEEEDDEEEDGENDSEDEPLQTKISKPKHNYEPDYHNDELLLMTPKVTLRKMRKKVIERFSSKLNEELKKEALKSGPPRPKSKSPQESSSSEEDFSEEDSEVEEFCRDVELSEDEFLNDLELSEDEFLNDCKQTLGKMFREQGLVQETP